MAGGECSRQGRAPFHPYSLRRCSPRRLPRSCLGMAELPDGTMALVAVRDIAAGENFSLAPSDSEESENGEEGEESDEEAEFLCRPCC